MTDENAQGKMEMSKEVLAPADGPREEMISTAVKFLQNPKVQQSPFSQRKSFLERKGLTKQEIDIAVERSGVPPDKPTQVYPPQPPGIQPPPQGALLPYQPVPPVSTLGKVRDILHTIALVGGLSYAAYRFMKDIVLPWIYGKPKTEDRLDKIENMVIDLQKNIVETLSKIQVTLTSMQETMTANQEKVQAISHEVYTQRSNSAMTSIGDTQFATEMKTELQTLKGLLLNRRQFPPTPSSSSITLPSWQLEQSSSSSGVKPSLVKPSGDAVDSDVVNGDAVNGDALLNKNESDRRGQDSAEETKITFSETSMEGSGDKKDTVDSNGTLIKDNTSTEESKGAVKFEDTGSDAEVD